jgi:hypothetical protein
MLLAGRHCGSSLPTSSRQLRINSLLRSPCALRLSARGSCSQYSNPTRIISLAIGDGMRFASTAAPPLYKRPVAGLVAQHASLCKNNFWKCFAAAVGSWMRNAAVSKGAIESTVSCVCKMRSDNCFHKGISLSWQATSSCLWKWGR